MTRSYSSLLFWLGLTIVTSLMLYHTSDRVNALDQQLRSINTQIEAEQESLHILKAEWVYLANPTRVEMEVHHHLTLQATPPRHIVALQDIASLLPTRDGVEPQIQIAQAASVKTETPIAAAHPKINHIITALNTTHINDHMIMQHAAVAQASTDSIGALIGSLGLHP